ncbi:HtaA domain-containing protein [Georgenia sp. SYP-B2076]|uniref:HtaA domain-containing protein n=1 Tax=Georgenia sp. SYP-B2076 TaxID=2495881 RepID=UPI0013DE8B7B|nr:HtaA domain-containing protein [Georgenia sp. SYP-B2076]
MTADPARTAGPAGDDSLPGPGLTWGLKRSFIRYISRLPDGGHRETDGASLTHGSFFTFEPADGSTYDPSTGTGVLKFRGDVRLTGHHNMLFVMIADPWIALDGGAGVLSVIDSRHWPDRDRRIPLATLTLGAPAVSGAGYVWGETPAYLSEEGQAVFNEQYAAGEELDPVFVVYPTRQR